MARWYGRGETMSLLANAGIDILCKHKYTQANALHVAIERGHYQVASLLINSDFPLDERNNGGFTPLIIASSRKSAYSICI